LIFRFYSRIKGLAREVFTTYAKSKDDAEPLVLVCVLKSAFKFFYALQQELEILNTEENGLGVTRSVLQNGNSDGPINGKNGVTQSASNRVLPLLCEFIRVKSYVNTTSEVNNSVQIQGLLDPGQTFSQKVGFQSKFPKRTDVSFDISGYFSEFSIKIAPRWFFSLLG
jgi:hypothetical protein